MKRVAAVVAACLLLAASYSPEAAGRTWIQATSPHFVVLSDTGERTTKTVAWQLEQLRTALEAFWSWANVELDRPLVVLAVGDEAGMKTLAPQFWERRNGVRPASIFATGYDRHFIALRTDERVDDTVGINPYIVAYWSYVNLVVENAVRRDLPLWVSRGLANVMSNTIVRPSRIDVGQPIPWYLQRLQATGVRLRLADLAKVDRTSPWYTDGDKLNMLDAECWAFVHFLMFGDEGAHRQQFDKLLALLIQGTPPAGALETALGRIDALEAPFVVYMNRQIFQYLRVNLAANLRPDKFVTAPVTPADATLARAAFHVALQRPSEARAAIDEVRKVDANAVGAFEEEGMLFELEGRLDEARAAFAKASASGSKRFYVHFRLAQLLWSAGSRDEAQREGRAAVAAATTTAQRKAAQNFLDLAARTTPPLPRLH